MNLGSLSSKDKPITISWDSLTFRHFPLSVIRWREAHQELQPRHLDGCSFLSLPHVFFKGRSFCQQGHPQRRKQLYRFIPSREFHLFVETIKDRVRRFCRGPGMPFLCFDAKRFTFLRCRMNLSKVITKTNLLLELKGFDNANEWGACDKCDGVMLRTMPSSLLSNKTCVTSDWNIAPICSPRPVLVECFNFIGIFGSYFWAFLDRENQYIKPRFTFNPSFPFCLSLWHRKYDFSIIRGHVDSCHLGREQESSGQPSVSRGEPFIHHTAIQYHRLTGEMTHFAGHWIGQRTLFQKAWAVLTTLLDRDDNRR
mgnify:CR=1 FL=1